MKLIYILYYLIDQSDSSQIFLSLSSIIISKNLSLRGEIGGMQHNHN